MMQLNQEKSTEPRPDAVVLSTVVERAVIQRVVLWKLVPSRYRDKQT